MKVTKMSADEAVQLIADGDTVVTGGFIGCGVPEEIEAEIERSFLEKGKPRNLTLIYSAGQGDGKDKGINHLGHESLVKKVIGGHWGLAPKLQKLALENKIEAYNLPQGVISHLFRDVAAGRPGTITHVGLKTFVDPRLEGGKINSITKEELVEVVQLDGQDYLRYKPFHIDVALLRGTYCDEDGNVTLEEEAVSLDTLSIAQACRNCGGKVIVQVKKIVKSGTLDPKLVKIPGIYVDAVVEVSDESNHQQTFATDYDSCMAGNSYIPLSKLEPLPLNERKIIGRRCAMELTKGSVVNLGIGMPEMVSNVANEEGFGDQMTLTVESGPVGGMPLGGLNFGTTLNGHAILDQPYQFDFYDGGGLDAAFLGLAQCDAKGNINVSKFGPKIPGCGGFINITQNAKKVVYCGTFTAGGLKIACDSGRLKILQEGKVSKFLKVVEQVTFSGDIATSKKQPVIYVTERAVFELSDKGLVLTEIAPGVELQKDILELMDFDPIIADDLKLMDERIFSEDKMDFMI